MTTTLTNSTIATSLILLSLASSTSAQDAVQWRTEDGGNGHWYAFRLLEADCEAEATAAAGMFGAHLATATSEDENLLMDSLIPDSEPGAYIGGFQVTGTEEDSLGWYWVTGEAWDYTAWDTNQPSGGSSEDCLFMYSLDYANASGWHDNVHFACGSDTLQRPYIIEWSADCNGDGIVDYGQILDGSLADSNGNGIPDCCDEGRCLPPAQWRVEDGGNGHWYQLVETDLTDGLLDQL
ncbi:MAG: lectin-like protein, partial [Planctomycetota bacterium]|nr:lectin-like protein [Planctomycetota bacterium]